MEKRGMAVMFKWAFAILAGIVIFLFLINFAYKHIYLSETKTSALLLTSLESQLDSLSVSEFLSEDSIDFGEEVTLNFGCDSISTDKGKVNIEKIIFTNNQLTSKDFSLFTQTWSHPFDITNFFYITDKKTNYYFFNKPFYLTSLIPSTFNVFYSPDEVPKDAVLVFFRQPTAEELAEYKNHQIKIVQDDIITFYPDKSTNFQGDEMLLGAIFTDDINKFNCLKNKALQKLKLVSFVYQKKAQQLAKFECQDQYQNIINQLTNFKDPDLIDNLDREIERNGCTPLFQ